MEEKAHTTAIFVHSHQLKGFLAIAHKLKITSFTDWSKQGRE
jgi:hypothetical protein